MCESNYPEQASHFQLRCHPRERKKRDVVRLERDAKSGDNSIRIFWFDSTPKNAFSLYGSLLGHSWQLCE
jgi:hypothetical protein